SGPREHLSKVPGAVGRAVVSAEQGTVRVAAISIVAEVTRVGLGGSAPVQGKRGIGGRHRAKIGSGNRSSDTAGRGIGAAGRREQNGCGNRREGGLHLRGPSKKVGGPGRRSENRAIIKTVFKTMT